MTGGLQSILPGQLLEEMSRHGIDRTLVYAVQGEWISPMQGNDLLAVLTGGK